MERAARTAFDQIRQVGCVANHEYLLMTKPDSEMHDRTERATATSRVPGPYHPRTNGSRIASQHSIGPADSEPIARWRTTYVPNSARSIPSAGCRCVRCTTCGYVSIVMAILTCPGRSETIFACIPSVSSDVVCVLQVVALDRQGASGVHQPHERAPQFGWCHRAPVRCPSARRRSVAAAPTGLSSVCGVSRSSLATVR